MSKVKAIILGIFTLWPILYMLIFKLIAPDLPINKTHDITFAALSLLFLHPLTVIEGIVLIVIYVAHMYDNQLIPQKHKKIWAIALILGYLIFMAIYWCLYIWPKPNKLKTEPAAVADR